MFKPNTASDSIEKEGVDVDKKIAYIDGQAFNFVPGESILSFINRSLGDDSIPSLCDAPNLKPYGSCRVCSVDVALEENGNARAQASCHTPVLENSYIYPHSDRIKTLRKNIIELVLTDYPEEKINDNKNGTNELQVVAKQVGMEHSMIRYPEGKNHFDFLKDDSHAYMRADLSTCINCYRCVRACDEVQGQHVLSVEGRGFDSKIVMGLGSTFADSDCVSCGACSQACPTGAITDIFDSKAVVADEEIRTVCTYCGVGCNLSVKVKDGAVAAITAPYEAESNEGHTCLKGRYAFKFYDHADRLRSPLIKVDGVFQEASWDEAYDFIAKKLHSIIDTNGPDAVAGISSSRCTNEENYLMQKFIRAVVGTNNIDCCARVCHSPTALGMQRSFGTGAATNSIKDLKKTDCIILIGANPTSGHPVTGAKIKQTVMGGAKLIVVDPRKIELSKYADFHLQLRPGTNVAMLNMLLHYIIKEGVVDESFVADRTEGFDDFKNMILALDMDKLSGITGVDKDLARNAALCYATAKNAMEFHGLGVTEHSQGTFTVQLIADLAMITGNIGREGVGVNPLRGQNNVQGAADMGCQPHQGAGYMMVDNADSHKQYEEFYGRPLSNEIGLKIPEMFDAAQSKDLKALWIMGEDVVQTDPNTTEVIKSMEALDLLVVQELFMTPTAEYADVVLPASSFLEKSGTFTNGERRIQRVNAVVEPLEGTKPDGQIIVDIMNRMGYDQPAYDADTMLQEISQIVPFFAGVTWDGLTDNGKQWPVTGDNEGTEILHTEEFKRGKGLFHFQEWRESNELIKNKEQFPFILTTGRELEHYNCGTMTRRTNNSIILSEDTLLIHPEDGKAKGLVTGDLACLSSAYGKVDLHVELTDQVKPGILYTTFHFPEVLVNLVTGNEHCSESMCPEYKVVAADIRKAKKVEERGIGEVTEAS
ncbi:MAG: formate dehydrogenase subunit alpha [Flavobacteriales bacterium]|nr:formate dehydrogenase subunit alpha [Flavobacteriales bacterium]